MSRSSALSSTRRWIRSIFAVLAVSFLFPRLSCFAARNDHTEGRYSFSLTTFDPDGKLGQVQRANVAANLGVPVVIAYHEASGELLMASPQFLPSPFAIDDGTARFAAITPTILMAHSGIAADGRVLVAAAQRLAVEHAYTFQEPVPMELLLQQMSLLMQEYTMKPASRPFGSTLVVAEVPAEETGDGDLLSVYCIDPSGAVTRQSDGVSVVHGNNIVTHAAVEELKTALQDSADVATLREPVRMILSQAVQKYAATQQQSESTQSDWNMYSSSQIVMATLQPSRGLIIERLPTST